jgi:uncharacterized membrane protein
MDTRTAADAAGKVVELGGVAALAGGLLAALLKSLVRFLASRQGDLAYRTLRRDVGKAILVGLEFLVAADVIRSIAITPTFESIGVLGLVVLVRTFLSWSLEAEVRGTAWRRPQGDPSADDGSRAAANRGMEDPRHDSSARAGDPSNEDLRVSV